MTETVKAAVKVAPEQTEIRTFDRPHIPANAALLRIESAGVGGSDPELYRNPKHAPIIMGHENVGTIDECSTARIPALHEMRMVPQGRVSSVHGS
jgi:D-arabinose 1-dehydrogenase-like Zn-dependent alcohol dehydrogenase